MGTEIGCRGGRGFAAAPGRVMPGASCAILRPLFCLAAFVWPRTAGPHIPGWTDFSIRKEKHTMSETSTAAPVRRAIGSMLGLRQVAAGWLCAGRMTAVKRNGDAPWATFGSWSQENLCARSDIYFSIHARHAPLGMARRVPVRCLFWTAVRYAASGAGDASALCAGKADQD